MINTIDLHVCTDIIKQEMNEHSFFRNYDVNSSISFT